MFFHLNLEDIFLKKEELIENFILRLLSLLMNIIEKIMVSCKESNMRLNFYFTFISKPK